MGILLLAVAARGLAAQSTRPIVLPAGRPVATAPFTRIDGVVPLGDGKLLVVDAGERALRLIDPRGGASHPVGRRGGGPQEFTAPAGAYALADGGAIVIDQAAGRRLRIRPDGSIAGTLPHPDGVAPSTELRGVDRRGRLYFQASPFVDPPPTRGAAPGPPRPRDSVEVLRWDPASSRWDTLARVRALPLATRRPGVGGGYMMVLPQPLGEHDAWAVAPDGGVLIARAWPYRVDAIDRGAAARFPIAGTRRAVTPADRDAYRAALAGTGRVQFQDREGRAGGEGPRPPDPLAGIEWPATMPLFEPSLLRADPSGALWIARTPAVGATVREYDVVDPRTAGRRVVRLSIDRIVVGFTRDALLLARRDEDDQQHLESVAWPTRP